MLLSIVPDGVVSYERKAAEDEVPWGECEDSLTDLTISESGTIEDVDEECLQIDFANKCVFSSCANKIFVR